MRTSFLRFRSFAFRFAFAAVIAGVATGVAACSSDDEPPLDNGVNDVALACQQRASYTDPQGEKCVQCLTVAALENCKCEAFEGFGGACEEQGVARRAEPTCTTSIDDCRRACAATDCACIDGCYAGADACKRRQAAEDGCVAKVCEKFCTADAG